MDSSEDDAGAAVASRRLTARESGSGHGEDHQNTENDEQLSAATSRASNPAAVDESFDGESVAFGGSSPSTHDVNTSTEAILDMIDEIVDGPGASKRVSCDTVNDSDSTQLISDIKSQQEISKAAVKDQHITASPSVESEAHEEKSNCSSLPSSEKLDATAIFSQNLEDPDVQPSLDECTNPKVAEVANVISTWEPSKSIEPLSSASTDNSESITHEQTIKCVTSSDSSSVTVENAESTSSDSSNISDVQCAGTSTRMPLKRKLVRPIPSDRKPDMTVSSTDDSQSQLLQADQGSSENVAKDVSSSSDALPTVNFNVKEDVSISAVSVCKAETSISPPKKIKLIRQKISVPVLHVASEKSNEALPKTADLCQSSSDITSQILSETSSITSSASSKENVGTCKENDPMINSVMTSNESSDVQSQASKHETENVSLPETSSKEILETVQNLPTHSKIKQNIESKVNCEKAIEKPSEASLTNKCSAVLLEKKVPPMKISLLSSPSETISSEDHEGHDEKKKVPPVRISLSATHIADKIEAEQSKEEEVKKVAPIKLNLTSPIMEPKKVPPMKINLNPANSTQPKIDDTKPLSVEKSKSEIVSEEQKKVPPMKITLNSPLSETSTIGNLKINEEAKTVPPIKLTLTQQPCSSTQFQDERKVPPMKINLSTSNLSEAENKLSENQKKLLPLKISLTGTNSAHNSDINQLSDCKKEELEQQKVPAVKLNLSVPEICKIEQTPPADNFVSNSESDKLVPKLTIKLGGKSSEDKSPIPKLTIKPLKPVESARDLSTEQVPLITKLNIKPIQKPVDNELQRKSSSSDISESEYSENDESNSASDQASVSDPHRPEFVPKMTIKLGMQNETDCRDNDLKTKMFNSEEQHMEKIPKLTIKTVSKCESQPLSPKLTIKLAEGKVEQSQSNQIPKLKITTDTVVCSRESENCPLPKITIKPVTKPDLESPHKTSKKESKLDGTETIPIVTKLNIKPIVKPDNEESSKSFEDKVPIVSKLHIKPVVKPKNDSTDNIKEDISEVKLNLRHVAPESNCIIKKGTLGKNCNKPGTTREEGSGDSEIVSSETGNSSDENTEHIPVVTKLNIKPIVKPHLVGKSDAVTKEPDKVNDFNELKIEKQLCKNPPLLMKISKKTGTEQSQLLNDIDKKPNHVDNAADPVSESIPVNIKLIANKSIEIEQALTVNCNSTSSESKLLKNLISPKLNCISESDLHKITNSIPERTSPRTRRGKTSNVEAIASKLSVLSQESSKKQKLTENKLNSQHTDTQAQEIINKVSHDVREKPHSPVQNFTVLKQLLGSSQEDKHSTELVPAIDNQVNTNCQKDNVENSTTHVKNKNEDMFSKSINENVTKPIEVNISEKVSNQSSGQDSPRIILKINKTEHGSSAQLITDEINKHPTQIDVDVNIEEQTIDQLSPKKDITLGRRKTEVDSTVEIPTSKRLRSTKTMIESEKSPMVRRSTGRKPATTDNSAPQLKETNLPEVQAQIGHLLANNTLSITPIVSHATVKSNSLDIKQSEKTMTHAILNNENCSKNGNSKLHDILTNLQSKQVEVVVPLKETENSQSATHELVSCTSKGSSSCEITPINSAQEELNVNAETSSSVMPEETSQDPLELGSTEPSSINLITNDIPIVEVITPQPRKRGRPRKVPLSEPPPPKPEPAKMLDLPTPALEERPLRSLRLTRERPVVTPTKRGRGGRGRGRGRGRGAMLAVTPAEPTLEPVVDIANKLFDDKKKEEEIDPTSSRIKLPRMTEALDKIDISTPVTSRRRDASTDTDSNFGSSLRDSLADSKFVDGDSKAEDSLLKLDDSSIKSPETPRGRGRGRGGRGRGVIKTPQRGSGRGKGKGGGRGCVYMRETMGIYGRVCGPTTSNVELFEEETCMMDDNATPAKPLIEDEDSQSSVMSSTNESSRTRKSKFADLYNSNKVWTAADVKEYTWPPPGVCGPRNVMMIQEQVAMFLEVKSFKRRYPELKRRAIVGEERDYVLEKGLVTKAICDLGITAVDASEVLDIMLSDYPHKYEEYRVHQRTRQQTEPETAVDTKQALARIEKIEMKKSKEEEKEKSDKPEPPKVDPVKARQEAALAAIASASEWNARLNAARRPAAVDMQTMIIHRRRTPIVDPKIRVEPPAGFYPHALLPGQYQHWYRAYTPEQLRYFPLNTALAAPPAPPSPPPPPPPPADSSTDTEDEWGERSSAGSDTETHNPAKRRKLTKLKRRSSLTDGSLLIELNMPTRDEADLCRTCKKEEGKRNYFHEKFLVCSTCNAKLHPGCVELSADTIRKCRDYAWQCAECKACCACTLRTDHDKMLFCELCDRGAHLNCVGLSEVPNGRWHCDKCAICKSCGARDPAGPEGGGGGATRGSLSAPGGAEWRHYTKRGPGGTKVYSHSHCAPCARAYRIGRYCPLCERSFIGPKGTMQLVICKLCDRQLHQECVRARTSRLDVLDYTCAECVRGGITSRSAAVKAAPRTLATLFMAKRRFNKYAHRQYLESRKQEALEKSALETVDVVEEESRPEDASEASEDPLDTGADPLEGPEDTRDETAAAVEALRMDFGD